jgi:hypothetical protein
MADQDITTVIRTILDDKNFKTDKVVSEIDKVIKKQKENQKGASSLFSNLKAGWLAAAGVIAGAVATVTKALSSSINAYLNQEKANIALISAMKNSGTYTDKAAKHLMDYASTLQSLTVFEDDAIQGVQTLLVQFGLQGDELDKVTAATIDFATAMGMDLRSAGLLVAKSIGSDTNALQRYDISLEGATTKTEKAQKAVEAISKKFGGSAAAAAKTFSGRITQIKNDIGDMQEVIGGSVVNAISPLTDAFHELVTGMKESEAANNALKGLGFVLVTIITLFDQLQAGWVTAFNLFKGMTKTLIEIFGGLGTVIKDVFTLNFRAIGGDVKIALLQIQNAVVESATKIADTWIGVVGRAAQGYKNVLNGIQAETVTSQTKTDEELLSNAEDAVKKLAELQDYLLDVIGRTQSQEIQEVEAKYVKILSDAKKYGASLVQVEEAKQKEIQGVRDKYDKIAREQMSEYVDLASQAFSGLGDIASALGYEDQAEGLDLLGASIGDVGKLVASGGADVGAWIDLAKNAITGIIDFFDLTGEKAEKAAEEAAAAEEELATKIAETEQELADLLYDIESTRIDNAIDLLEKERDAKLEAIETTSAAALRLKAIEDAEDAKSYKKLNKREREKIDLQKQMAEEQAAIEAEYNAKIEAQERAKFQLEKEQKIAQAKISKAEAEANYLETFGKKDAQTYIDQSNSMYDNLISLIQAQSYAKGSDALPSDQLAMVHKGERIIPASMNAYPSMDNTDFVSAMMRGMQFPSMAGATAGASTTNNNSYSNSYNINMHNVNSPMEFVNKLKSQYGINFFKG